MECEVADWSAWAQCDAAAAQKKRTRPIVTQPEGGKACPLLDEASACSGAEMLLLFIINGVRAAWNWVLVVILGFPALLKSQISKEMLQSIWVMIKKAVLKAASAARLLLGLQVREIAVGLLWAE